MPQVNIAPDISNTQTANFFFSLIIELPARAIFDEDSFDLSNISLSGSSHISASNLTLINLNRGRYRIAVAVPDESTGSFTVGVTGNVRYTTSGGVIVDEALTGTARSISYDTSSNIQATFGSIEYHDDGRISVPLSLETSVQSLHRTDFELSEISGDDIDCMEYWLTGSGSSYEMWFLPEEDTEGIFLCDIFGEIVLSSGVTREEVSVTPIEVPYNRIEPLPTRMTFPQILAESSSYLGYLDFNVVIKDLYKNSFDIEGIDAEITGIYRAVSITNKPSASDYSALTDTTKWILEDIDTPTTEKGRWFVLVFQVPTLTGENLDVFVKDDAVINAVYP